MAGRKHKDEGNELRKSNWGGRCCGASRRQYQAGRNGEIRLTPPESKTMACHTRVLDVNVGDPVSSHIMRTGDKCEEA